MDLCEILTGAGEDGFQDLLRGISLGKLRTYLLFDRIKARARLVKLNSEHLRKAAPKLWERLTQKDADLATDLSQAILISHIEMVIAVLNFLEIPHEEGFFAKDIDASKHLTEGWQERTWQQFRETYPRPLLLFYINHLALELAKDSALYAPAA